MATGQGSRAQRLISRTDSSTERGVTSIIDLRRCGYGLQKSSMKRWRARMNDISISGSGWDTAFVTTSCASTPSTSMSVMRMSESQTPPSVGKRVPMNFWNERSAFVRGPFRAPGRACQKYQGNIGALMQVAHCSHVWNKPGMSAAERYRQLWRELALCDAQWAASAT